MQSQLIRQFWGEALLLCTVALLAGLVLAETTLPAVNRLFGLRLALTVQAGGGLLAGMACLLLLAGVLAGAAAVLALRGRTARASIRA